MFDLILWWVALAYAERGIWWGKLDGKPVVKVPGKFRFSEKSHNIVPKEGYVINPQTGLQVKIGGSTHKCI